MRYLITVAALAVTACGPAAPFNAARTCETRAGVVAIAGAQTCDDATAYVAHAYGLIGTFVHATPEQLDAVRVEGGIRWHDTSEVEAFGDSAGGMYWPVDDAIEVTSCPVALAHELLHAYETKALGSSYSDAHEHVRWADDSTGFKGADADFAYNASAFWCVR